jgi:putative heme degradation protein
VAKVGGDGKKDLLQTFDIKGSSVSKVFVNQDFTQFVTLDDAGILYILDELLPPTAGFK